MWTYLIMKIMGHLYKVQTKMMIFTRGPSGHHPPECMVRDDRVDNNKILIWLEIFKLLFQPICMIPLSCMGHLLDMQTKAWVQDSWIGNVQLAYTVQRWIFQSVYKSYKIHLISFDKQLLLNILSAGCTLVITKEKKASKPVAWGAVGVPPEISDREIFADVLEKREKRWKLIRKEGKLWKGRWKIGKVIKREEDLFFLFTFENDGNLFWVYQNRNF